jgi:hypothetical protein
LKKSKVKLPDKSRSAALISEIKGDVEAVGNNALLYDEVNFSDRAEAIDFLEFHVIERIDTLLNNADRTEKLNLLKQEALEIKQKLEQIDTVLFQHIRKEIRECSHRGDAFLVLVKKYLGGDIFDNANKPKAGYDELDTFVNGLLLQTPLPEATLDRLPEMVFYQQTPVRIIFELAAKANLQPGDVFYDIGSGLGHVPILVNLLTGVLTKGVEFEPAYCNYATTCADELTLADVHFINADARVMKYSDGTVFFLYTPFEGRMLDETLDRLHVISESRSIKLFTYGPCTLEVARRSWLTGTEDGNNNIYQLSAFSS